MKTLFRTVVAVALLMGIAHAESGSHAAPKLKQVDWAFDGAFGKFDRVSVQRGLQVYKEVCSACHSLKRVPFRRLSDIGLSGPEVNSFAAGYTVKDGPNDMGEMFERPGRPSDAFPSTYPNDNAARAANNGAMPPDLSLIIKARADGANYVYSLLTSYGHEAPEGVTVPDGAYYNPIMPGGIIKMPPPLKDDTVTYQDGTAASTDQEARDIVNFLQWAAEPEMEQRKRMGMRVMLFLGIMTAFFYITKKRIWSNLH